MRRPILLLLCLSCLGTSGALGQLRHVPLERRVDLAAVILEGRVVASTPFMDPADGLIHTAHRIESYTAFKLGRVAISELEEIELITPGGRLGDELHVVHPSLSLVPGDAGLFFIDIRQDHAGRASAFVPHASALGFVRYARDGSALDPFEKYADVPSALIDRIRQRTGQSPLELRPGSPAAGFADEEAGTSLVTLRPDSAGPIESGDDEGASAPEGSFGSPQQMSGGGGSGGPDIIGFSPGTVRAGVQDVLTINGSGFGTLTGPAGVLFDDAIDGAGGTFKIADPEHIVSWSDTQIQVYVPNLTGGKVSAGTGKVIVRDALGVDAVSPGDLTVEYAITEILSYGIVNRVRHIDQNAMGGYTLKFSTSTANGGVDFTALPDAMDRFADAIESWKCATGWNVAVNGTTSVAAIGNDGVNIVTFDNDLDPLPAGTLGRTTSFFQGCTGDTWRVVGMDFRFRRDGTGSADWYYGTNPAGQGPGEDDFESVALHELGHAVQHDHINDPADPMYFSISIGSNKRVLSAADTSGGLDVVGHSAGFVACQHTGMIAFDCAAPPTSEFLGSPRGACGSSLAVDFSDMSMNGPTGWSWSFGDAAVSAARDPTHTYTSQGIFSVSLDASNANGSDMEMKSEYVVVKDAPVPPSCAPSFDGHNNCCGIGIKNVTLSSIDRSSGTPKDGDPLEEDFTCSDFGLLEAGTSYPISVTTGSGNNEDVKVYVDWDNDGSLETSELAFQSDNTQPVHSGMISVPTTAVRDTALRMRVLSDFASRNIVSSCENIDYGQVENYSLIVAAEGQAGGPGIVPGASFTLTKNANTALIDFDWSPSCGAAVTDYSIHEGTLWSYYSHSSVVCSTGGATTISGLAPAPGNRYFLVAPLSASHEGSYGRGSAAIERPASTTTCVASQDVSACP